MEMAAVVLTAIGKFTIMGTLRWRLPYIIAVMTLWGIYIYRRYKTIPGIMSYWGFRTDNFNTVMKRVLPFGLVALAACITTGVLLKTIHLTWHIIPLLILYPAWGVIQQFLLISLVAGNLKDYKGLSHGNAAIIILTALFFGLVHYPWWWLMGGTFILALFYGYIYLKEQNIYVLGLFHGWLAAVYFYTVVGRDPFMETFGRWFHIGCIPNQLVV